VRPIAVGRRSSIASDHGETLLTQGHATGHVGDLFSPTGRMAAQPRPSWTSRATSRSTGWAATTTGGPGWERGDRNRVICYCLDDDSSNGVRFTFPLRIATEGKGLPFLLGACGRVVRLPTPGRVPRETMRGTPSAGRLGRKRVPSSWRDLGVMRANRPFPGACDRRADGLHAQPSGRRNR